MLDFLRREGIDPGIISAIEDFRTAHSVPEEVRRRVKAAPRFASYGK